MLILNSKGTNSPTLNVVYLNTSYVDIKHVEKWMVSILIQNLNTSYVDIKQTFLNVYGESIDHLNTSYVDIKQVMQFRGGIRL